MGSWLPFVGHIPTAEAHAFVIGSDPIDGSTISKAPAVVWIFFDAPIASNSQAKVYTFPPGGPASGLLVNAGQSSINAHNSRELDTALLPASKLPLGGYEVRWSALSLTDGHTTGGLIGFNLGQSSLGVSGVPLLGPSTSNYVPQLSLQGILAVAWDWLVLLALFFWIGILVSEYFIIPRAAPAHFLTQTRKRSASLQVLCLAALLAGEVINLVLRATTFTSTVGNNGISLDMLNWFALHTTYGWLWLVRVGLLALALLLLGWHMYRQRQFQENQAGPAPKSNRAN
ncbi:MAG: copper resistance CopC family protein, partial [Ktedonobacteraceae bacterium]